MQKYTVYAFANAKGEGNGAGVVLMDAPQELSDREKQEIAAEFGFSETAFLYKDRDFVIRYFTPACEVPLCGHATIASFSLLYQEKRIGNGTYRLQTKEKVLPVTVEDGFVWMDFGLPKVEKTLESGQIDDLCAAYGLVRSDLNPDCPVRIVNAGIRDIHMIVKDHETLMRAKQDAAKSLALTGCFGEVGVHMSCLADAAGAARTPDKGTAGTNGKKQYTAYCSNFGPAFGIEEECATGTATAGLSAYLAALGKYPEQEAVFLQGEHMGRPSEIRSRMAVKDGKKHILIGGRGYVAREAAG